MASWEIPEQNEEKHMEVGGSFKRRLARDQMRGIYIEIWLSILQSATMMFCIKILFDVATRAYGDWPNLPYRIERLGDKADLCGGCDVAATDTIVLCHLAFSEKNGGSKIDC